MKKIILLIMLVTLAFSVSATTYDLLNTTIPNQDLEVNKNIFIAYNTTLEVGDFIYIWLEEVETGKQYQCYTYNNNGSVTVNQYNKYCNVSVSDVGLYTVYTWEYNGGAIAQQRENYITVRHSRPDVFTSVVGVLGIGLMLLTGVLGSGALILGLLMLITSLIILLFQYSYLLNPIFIGVLGLLFIGLLYLLYEIFQKWLK